MNQTITLNGGRSSLKATPQRLIEILHARDAIKTPSVKAFRAAQMRKTDKRAYPRFIEGQSTAEYVERYWQLNGHTMGLVCGWVNRNTERRPLEGEVQRLINGLYEPLGTTPQYTPLFDGVEESCDA